MGHTTLPFKLSTKISITCSSVIIFIELIKREVYSKEKKYICLKEYLCTDIVNSLKSHSHDFRQELFFSILTFTMPQ